MTCTNNGRVTTPRPSHDSVIHHYHFGDTYDVLEVNHVCLGPHPEQIPWYLHLFGRPLEERTKKVEVRAIKEGVMEFKILHDLLSIVRIGRHMSKGVATTIKIHVHLFVRKRKKQEKGSANKYQDQASVSDPVQMQQQQEGLQCPQRFVAQEIRTTRDALRQYYHHDR